jgi:hypothetical protein
MFPEGTRFDEAARFLIRQGGGPLLAWLLAEPPEELRFRGWLDSVVTLPGTKERLCDAIARLETPDGAPLALLVEVQTTPDASMFGRLCVAGGILWMTVKPNDLPGDRYGLMALVINLTGTGNSGRTFRRPSSVWEMSPCEWNLEDRDAESILAEVEAGRAPLEVLAFISLMKKGGDDGIIRRWLEVVGKEPSRERRGNLTLVAVFAERTGCTVAWKKALEGFEVIESTIVNEWKAAAARKSELRVKAEMLLRLVKKLPGDAPEELNRAIRDCEDLARLDSWVDAGFEASSLDDFRRNTGL